MSNILYCRVGKFLKWQGDMICNLSFVHLYLAIYCSGKRKRFSQTKYSNYETNVRDEGVTSLMLEYETEGKACIVKRG